MPFRSYLSLAVGGLVLLQVLITFSSAGLTFRCAAFCSVLRIVCLLFPQPGPQLLLPVWFILVE